jgi:hypothetical protein
MAKGLILIVLLGVLPAPLLAQESDEIELRITTIKGNKELPKILYIVPWKEVEHAPKPQRQLVLHSLFGDLFEPVLPAAKN